MLKFAPVILGVVAAVSASAPFEPSEVPSVDRFLENVESPIETIEKPTETIEKPTELVEESLETAVKTVSTDPTTKATTAATTKATTKAPVPSKCDAHTTCSACITDPECHFCGPASSILTGPAGVCVLKALHPVCKTVDIGTLKKFVAQSGLETVVKEYTKEDCGTGVLSFPSSITDPKFQTCKACFTGKDREFCRLTVHFDKKIKVAAGGCITKAEGKTFCNNKKVFNGKGLLKVTPTDCSYNAASLHTLSLGAVVATSVAALLFL